MEYSLKYPFNVLDNLVPNENQDQPLNDNDYNQEQNNNNFDPFLLFNNNLQDLLMCLNPNKQIKLLTLFFFNIRMLLKNYQFVSKQFLTQCIKKLGKLNLQQKLDFYDNQFGLITNQSLQIYYTNKASNRPQVVQSLQQQFYKPYFLQFNKTNKKSVQFACCDMGGLKICKLKINDKKLIIQFTLNQTYVNLGKFTLNGKYFIFIEPYSCQLNVLDLNLRKRFSKQFILFGVNVDDIQINNQNLFLALISHQSESGKIIIFDMISWDYQIYNLDLQKMENIVRATWNQSGNALLVITNQHSFYQVRYKYNLQERLSLSPVLIDQRLQNKIEISEAYFIHFDQETFLISKSEDQILIQKLLFNGKDQILSDQRLIKKNQQQGNNEYLYVSTASNSDIYIAQLFTNIQDQIHFFQIDMININAIYQLL